jgi:branched-chain amino acid aminotransferase
MQKNTHSYIHDSRNNNIKIYINGDIYNRSDAKISVFDSGFLLGDGIWEGMRLHNKQLCFLDEHLNRLYSGAQSIKINIPYSKKELSQIIYDVIKANEMVSDVHLRIIVSRGEKTTPYQHPSANIGPISLVIIPEYKVADDEINQRGLKIGSVQTIRGTEFNQDPKINSLSKFNCIAACLEGINKNVDEALMLDINGHVSTCNSTNFFIVKDNQVITSKGQYCLNGVTRANIIKICQEESIDIIEKDFNLEATYSAHEAFVTGTFAGVIPVINIDNHMIGSGKQGPLTNKIFKLYKNKINQLYPNEK